MKIKEERTMYDLSRELQSCGMSFFVEYFERFCRINWHDDMQVNACEQDIMNELSQKKRPDGGKYTYNGLSIRFSSVFVIFAQGMQYDALKLIANSSHTPPTVRERAQRYLDLAIKEQRKREELLLEQKRAEQEQLRKEEEKRIAIQKAKEAEENHIAQEKEREEKRIATQKQREIDEKRIAQEQKEKAILQLKEKLSQQEKVLAGTKKWPFCGKNAKRRKETLREINELKRALQNFGELI